MGVAHNSGFCLGLYSFLMVVLLIAQAVLAVAFFADDSWKKHLPHDETGEAEKVRADLHLQALHQSQARFKGVWHMQMAKFLQHKLNIVRWVGLGALVIQVRDVLGKDKLQAVQLYCGVRMPPL